MHHIQGHIQDFKLGSVKWGGLRDGSPPAGSRGKAPVGVLGEKVPQKLEAFCVWHNFLRISIAKKFFLREQIQRVLYFPFLCLFSSFNSPLFSISPFLLNPPLSFSPLHGSFLSFPTFPLEANRDVVLSTCICTWVLLEYHFEVLVLEGQVLVDMWQVPVSYTHLTLPTKRIV